MNVARGRAMALLPLLFFALSPADSVVRADILEHVKGKDDNLRHCEGHCISKNHCQQFSSGARCVNMSKLGSPRAFANELRKFGCDGELDLSGDVSYCVDLGKKDRDYEDMDKQAWENRPTNRPTLQPTTSYTRQWDNILTNEHLSILTKRGQRQAIVHTLVLERDPFKFTEEPTSSPSLVPTIHPTGSPTTSPTSYPTSTPTHHPYLPNQIPDDPPSGYFDYSYGNRRDENGPHNWANVNASDAPEALYWAEFDHYIRPSLTENMCDNPRSSRQSPIDVRFDWAKAQCFEYHEIRHKAGEYGVTRKEVKKQILPSKLRLLYPRVVDETAEWATKNDSVLGASADMPKRWGHQLPVIHIDIKIPSEHYMEGKQYAAEYQINLIQNREEKRRGAPVVSVLFDIDPEEKDNFQLGLLIDEFQKVFDKDEAECENYVRLQRHLEATFAGRTGSADSPQSTWLDEPEEEEAKFRAKLSHLRRRAQFHRKWNPFNPEIMTSPWFYGYEGSLTEPPCTEFVEWRIMLKPALISTRQLEQMKTILFKHRNGKCQGTSVHSTTHGVARPLQNYNGRELYQCTCRDFIPDDMRQEYGLNRCLWSDRAEFGFDRATYTQEWYAETHPYLTIEEKWEATGKPWWG